MRGRLHPALPVEGATQAPTIDGGMRLEETQKRAIVDELVRENAGLKRQIADLERENNRFANLYIALKQIYASLDFDEAVRAIAEVILNYLGGARFTLLITDDSKSLLTPIASVGMEDEPVRVGEGVVGRVAETGEAFWADAAGAGAKSPLVAVPLRLRSQVVGVIAIYSLLPQKKQWNDLDREILALLEEHGGIAMLAARAAAKRV